MAWRETYLVDVVLTRVFIPTGGVEPARYGTGLPVRFGQNPVKPGGIRISNQKPPVQAVPTGIPTGSTGSRSFNKKNELVENLTCFQI
jgi:hypothetical protein